MEEIATIDHAKVKFLWVSDHYDQHLKGLCKYEESTCVFQCEYQEDKVKIFKLSEDEERDWLTKKYLFEVFVGYHWSYPERTEGAKYNSGDTPSWLRKRLTDMYFKTIKDLLAPT